MMSDSFLSGISSAFPKYKVCQEEIKELGREIFSSKIDFNKIEKVFDNSGVRTRYLVNNIDWYKCEHNWVERHSIFKKNAVSLLKKSISETLEKTGTKVEDIGGIVFVNSTGISTPTIDAEIFNLFKFKNNILRLPIFGYGCAGGVLGLNRSIEIHKNIKKPILVCNVELCSLTFRPQIFSKENIISSALFGDGAVSYLVGEKGYCKTLESQEYTWKNTLNLMGWNIENDGLAVIFDKIIPDFISDKLPEVIENFSIKNFDGYILHSGGMKVIKAYREIFNNHQTIKISEQILSDYGNVSSVSVLLVLERIINNGLKGTFLMGALGPGFTAGLIGLDISSND